MGTFFKGETIDPKIWLRATLCLMPLLCTTAVRAQADVETIVFVRHGEKPEEGLGQLNCQGLNRALALPTVIARTFGTPNFIFAPDPSVQKDDEGQSFDYVRPLATVEPTAIRFGLPVNASIGWSAVAELQAELERPEYRNALILVAWEHKIIETEVSLMECSSSPFLGPQGRQARPLPRSIRVSTDSLRSVNRNSRSQHLLV
jgi:hypothetical protein